MAVAVRLRCNRTASRFLVCDRSIASRLRLSLHDVALVIWVRIGSDTRFGFLWLPLKLGSFGISRLGSIGHSLVALAGRAAAQHGVNRLVSRR